MKNTFFTFVLLFSIINCLSSQHTIHDFTVTDVDGKKHNLYNDYLANGKVVLLKFFFTSCPICISQAPSLEQKYLNTGAGKQKIEFLLVTTLDTDNNPQVKGYKNTYSQSMPAISQEGNANQIVGPFKSSQYGSWWGSPSYAVITPDKKFKYPVFANQLDNAINEALNTPVVAPSTTFNLNTTVQNLSIPDDQVKFYLKPKNVLTPKIEIKKDITGNLKFSYPSADFPEMVSPVIVLESSTPAYSPALTASDLVAIRKHILVLEQFKEPIQLLAADVNSDGQITAGDIVSIRKVILGLDTNFPNNTPSYKSIPSEIEVKTDPGKTISLDMQIVKIGNVN